MHQPLSNNYAFFILWLSLHSFSEKVAKPNTVLNAIFTRLIRS